VTYEEEPEDLDDALAADLTELNPPDRSVVRSHRRTHREVAHADGCRRAHGMDLLRDWVEWFTVRYQISESVVPVLVQARRPRRELSALHTAHTVAFHPSDSGFGPIGARTPHARVAPPASGVRRRVHAWAQPLQASLVDERRRRAGMGGVDQPGPRRVRRLGVSERKEKA
jgi:hypothetical protein